MTKLYIFFCMFLLVNTVGDSRPLTALLFYSSSYVTYKQAKQNISTNLYAILFALVVSHCSYDFVIKYFIYVIKNWFPSATHYFFVQRIILSSQYIYSFQETLQNITHGMTGMEEEE